VLFVDWPVRAIAWCGVWLKLPLRWLPTCVLTLSALHMGQTIAQGMLGSFWALPPCAHAQPGQLAVTTSRHKQRCIRTGRISFEAAVRLFAVHCGVAYLLLPAQWAFLYVCTARCVWGLHAQTCRLGKHTCTHS
jgi:hypothetical protein